MKSDDSGTPDCVDIGSECDLMMLEKRVRVKSHRFSLAKSNGNGSTRISVTVPRSSLGEERVKR